MGAWNHCRKQHLGDASTHLDVGLMSGRCSVCISVDTRERREFRHAFPKQEHASDVDSEPHETELQHAPSRHLDRLVHAVHAMYY